MNELLDKIVPKELQSRLERGTVITIGNFDGVHRGHQSIIRDVTSSASRRDAFAVALTFEPHPAEIFTSKTATDYRIASAEERVELLRHYAIDEVVTISFTEEFAQLPPETFVIDLLIERLNAVEIHIGYDFAFGKGRAGNTRSLQSLCAAWNVDVVVHEAVAVEEAPISSTRVRESLREGSIGEASRLLGHAYSWKGVQVAGAQRGRDIGIPTVNLPARARMLPRLGVYATLILREGESRWRRSITNVGARPTFEDDGVPNVETHILDGDFQSEVGDTVRLVFLKFIRPEMRFDGAEALTEQIGRDVKVASRCHARIDFDALPDGSAGYIVDVESLNLLTD